MPFLQEGQDATVVIPATQSIRVGALSAAVAIVTIPAGLPGSPVTVVQDTQQVIGPFPSGATISVLANKGVAEYVVGATPVLTGQQYNPAAVAITGGTINATSVGATTRSTGAFTSVAANLASNITISGVGTVLTSPVLQTVNTVNAYTQIAIQNKSAAANSSADIIAYPNNNTNDTTGFIDIGVCSSGFADAAYTITAPNDAYLYGSAPSGAGTQGNLVIATDSTGSANSIQFFTGGYAQAKTAYRMQLDGTGNFYIKPPATPPTLANNGDVVFNLTSNTNLRISARGADGVTRVANITLA